MKGAGYTVEEHAHGILVRGPLPVHDMLALSKAWKKKGYTLLAQGVATAYGATFAVTSPDHLDAWTAEAEAHASRKAGQDPELAWLLGPDTGVSSRTIFSVLSRVGSNALSKHFGADVPLDPDDFGRCFRLLEQFPAWRERMGEVAAKYPAWAPLVREWPRLEALYREEQQQRRAPKLYKLICELRGVPA